MRVLFMTLLLGACAPNAPASNGGAETVHEESASQVVEKPPARESVQTEEVAASPAEPEEEATPLEASRPMDKCAHYGDTFPRIYLMDMKSYLHRVRTTRFLLDGHEVHDAEGAFIAADAVYPMYLDSRRGKYPTKWKDQPSPEKLLKILLKLHRLTAQTARPEVVGRVSQADLAHAYLASDLKTAGRWQEARQEWVRLLEMRSHWSEESSVPVRRGDARSRRRYIAWAKYELATNYLIKYSPNHDAARAFFGELWAQRRNFDPWPPYIIASGCYLAEFAAEDGKTEEAAETFAELLDASGQRPRSWVEHFRERQDALRKAAPTAPLR